jgi:DNA-binding NtrC family response regulator
VEKNLPRCVLVVDDEVLVRWQIVEILKRIGIEKIIECGDVACVRETVAREPIDLVFMDIDLGEAISGVDLAQEITSTQKIDLIYVSAHSNWAAHPRLEKTACAFVSKPFIESDIRAGIARCYAPKSRGSG